MAGNPARIRYLDPDIINNKLWEQAIRSDWRLIRHSPKTERMCFLAVCNNISALTSISYLGRSKLTFRVLFEAVKRSGKSLYHYKPDQSLLKKRLDNPRICYVLDYLAVRNCGKAYRYTHHKSDPLIKWLAVKNGSRQVKNRDDVIELGYFQSDIKTMNWLVSEIDKVGYNEMTDHGELYRTVGWIQEYDITIDKMFRKWGGNMYRMPIIDA